MFEIFHVTTGTGGSRQTLFLQPQGQVSRYATELERMLLQKQWLHPALTQTFIYGTGSERPLEDLGTRVEDAAETPAAPLAERVAKLRASLGLNHSQTAELLGVQRQTLYAWLNEAGTQQPQPANLERFARLERLADYWWRLLGAPAGDALRTVIGDRTVFARLGDDTPKIADACLALRALAQQVRAERKAAKPTLAQRLRARGFDPAPSGAALDQYIR